MTFALLREFAVRISEDVYRKPLLWDAAAKAAIPPGASVLSVHGRRGHHQFTDEVGYALLVRALVREDV